LEKFHIKWIREYFEYHEDLDLFAIKFSKILDFFLDEQTKNLNFLSTFESEYEYVKNNSLFILKRTEKCSSISTIAHLREEIILIMKEKEEEDKECC
jgi:hypothetical protein